jgi:PAS domain S-box-containing protein
LKTTRNQLLNEDSADCVSIHSDNDCFSFSHDTEGIFTFISPEITLILGYSQNEFLNHYSTYLTDAPENSKVFEYTNQSLSGNKQTAYPIQIYRKDRSTCWLEINETPIFDDIGNVIAVEGVAHDISENIKYKSVLKHVLEKTTYQNKLQAALDAADAGTFSYDVINDHSWWDNKSYDIFSVNPETYQNDYASWRKLVVSEDLAITEKKFKQALSSSLTRFEIDYRIHTNNNNIRWINVKAQITRNNKGQALWIDGLHLNITKTKELEIKLLESESRFRSLVEKSPDWIWEIDTEGYYTYTSPYIEDLLGYKPEEVIGQTFFSLMPGEERARLLSVFQNYIKKQQVFSAIEHTNLHKNGNLVILETNGSPIYNIDGQFIGYRGIHRDITERAETKKILIEKEIAEQANKSKSDFLANMSHELRTPMHAILSFSNFGIKKFNSAPPEKLLSYFNKINQSGERLLALLNDLLDLSKLEAGKLEFNFRLYELSIVLKQCIDEQEALLNEKNLLIKIINPEHDTQAEFDTVKVSQVITNFLSNAIKFSEQGTTLSIAIKANELFSDAGISNGLCLSITDQGIGIPDNELDTIFDKFIQSSKTKTGAGGTGLGLAICKEFIDAHGGRIWAEHNLPEGSVFSFVIPLKQGQAQ